MFKRLASELAKPARRRGAVNLSRIDANTKKGETAVVPGKVLGSGKLTKKVTVAAWKFSGGARDGIKSAGGDAITLAELVKKPRKNMRIIG